MVYLFYYIQLYAVPWFPFVPQFIWLLRSLVIYAFGSAPYLGSLVLALPHGSLVTFGYVVPYCALSRLIALRLFQFALLLRAFAVIALPLPLAVLQLPFLFDCRFALYIAVAVYAVVALPLLRCLLRLPCLAFAFCLLPFWFVRSVLCAARFTFGWLVGCALLPPLPCRCAFPLLRVCLYFARAPRLRLPLRVGWFAFWPLPYFTLVLWLIRWFPLRLYSVMAFIWFLRVPFGLLVIAVLFTVAQFLPSLALVRARGSCCLGVPVPPQFTPFALVGYLIR